VQTTASSESERLSLGGDEVVLRCTSEQSGGALLAIEVRIPPGGGPPVLHRHEPVELYRVDEGELTFHLEDGPLRAKGGTVVAIPGGSEHTVRNESDREARAFVVFAPGAAMEGFIRSAAELGSPAMDEVLALAAAHGIEMTRPVG
jgi:mannose-6-phosphate isomerase-like protein (cupin superfamily)